VFVLAFLGIGILGLETLNYLTDLLDLKGLRIGQGIQVVVYLLALLRDAGETDVVIFSAQTPRVVGMTTHKVY
jgi:hypothetical protein